MVGALQLSLWVGTCLGVALLVFAKPMLQALMGTYEPAGVR